MVVVNTDLIKKTQDIERTKESRKAQNLESKLLIDLNTILEFIIDNFDFKSSDYVTQLERIRKITYNQTYAVIRHYYQEAYLLGTTFVNEIFVSSPFLTHSDLDHITKQSDDYTNRFYGRLFKVLKKGNKEFYKSLFSNITNSSALINDDEQIELFAKQLEKASNYLYTSLAVLVISEALNSATIQKTQKLLQPTLQPSNTFTSTLQAGEATNKILREALEEELAKEAEPPQSTGFFVIPIGNTQPNQSRKNIQRKIKEMDISQMRYRWVARQDEKTCFECQILDGTEYTAEDNIPQIPDDSHFNCRCRIVVVSGSEITIE